MRRNNYSLGIAFGVIAGIGFSIAMLLLHGLGGIELPAWLIDLIYGVNFVLLTSQIVSGIGYLSRGVDIVTNENTILELLPYIEKDHKDWDIWDLLLNAQFVGIVVGSLAAIAFTALLVIFAKITGIDALIAFIGNVSAFAGLGNRIGRVIDYVCFNDPNAPNAPKEPLFRRKDVNYILGVISGILFGLGLSVGYLCLFGVASLTFPWALPIWPAVVAGVFVITITGIGASAGGYIGRIFDSLLGNRTAIGFAADSLSDDNEIELTSAEQENPINKRFNKEAILTLTGLAIGITIGMILIATGAMTLPLFGAGLPKLFAGFFVMGTCISGFAGLGNRFGHAWDKFAEEPIIEEDPFLLEFNEQGYDEMCNGNIQDPLFENLPSNEASIAVTEDFLEAFRQKKAADQMKYSILDSPIVWPSPDRGAHRRKNTEQVAYKKTTYVNPNQCC